MVPFYTKSAVFTICRATCLLHVLLPQFPHCPRSISASLVGLPFVRLEWELLCGTFGLALLYFVPWLELCRLSMLLTAAVDVPILTPAVDVDVMGLSCSWAYSYVWHICTALANVKSAPTVNSFCVCLENVYQILNGP